MVESGARRWCLVWVVWVAVAGTLLLAPGCKRESRGVDMMSLTVEERSQKFDEDLALIRRYDEGLTGVLDYAASHPELFPSKGVVALTPDQREELLQIWRSLLDYMWALDGIKGYWREFHRINPVTEREAHARAFLVGYAAWMVQYRHGLRFVDLTVPKPALETLLDEASSKHEIPAGAFAALKWNIINVKAVSRLLGSQQYMRTLDGTLTEAGCGKEAGCGWALGRIGSYHEASRGELKERAAIQFSYNGFDIVRDFGFSAWFPVQAGVAEWMGDTKVKRLHRHLVTHADLDAMQAKLEPGDIVVARHNWYLSNVGLPGFWPHAELYLGTWTELDAYFDTDEVKAFLGRLPGGHTTLSSYLKATWPEAWSSYEATGDDGTPMRIVEAVSEGVVFSSLYKGAGADYVGVMRPRFDKVAKAQAVIRAFGMTGRPYDFNFDFLTDEALVCTELVYKAWSPAEGKAGPKLDLQLVMGRTTLPANDIVRQFAAQQERPERELDFVYFLDGHEVEGKAVVSDVASFAASWERPKWDVLQK